MCVLRNTPSEYAKFAPSNLLITSTIEHHAVLHSFDYLEKREGFSVTRLPVDSDGRVSPADFDKAIRPETVFASVTAANNEIGVVQPIRAIADAAHAKGALMHTDAVQSAGKVPLDVAALGEDYRAGSRVIALTRQPDDLGALALEGDQWSRLEPDLACRVWSDDYSTILTPVLDMMRSR